MKKSYNVLSLFDGMSCGQIALKELNIPVAKYYASELDKHAIAQTQLNFPDTIQLGDVCKVKAKDLDKIDLVIGGSPCQGFSFAGKQLAFDDPRSKLFFEFVRLVEECRAINPSVKFMLENVGMKKEHQRVITDYLGVWPVNINSNLVSAQNRNRWYWTNIKTKEVGLFSEIHTDISQPKDRKIFLIDILQPEKEVDKKHYLSKKAINSVLINPDNLQKSNINPTKSNPLQCPGNSAGTYKGMSAVCVAMRGRNPDNPSDRSLGAPTEQRLEPKTDGKTNCLTSVAKDNLILQLNQSKESGGVQPYQQNRVYHTAGKLPALNAELGGRNNILIPEDFKLRRLTPLECSRLQTIPEWYKWECCDTQQYRMLGNGWTVEVIKHLFKEL